MTHPLRRVAIAFLVAALLAPLTWLTTAPAEAQNGPCLPPTSAGQGAQGGYGGRIGGERPTSPGQSATISVANADTECVATGEVFADSERLNDTQIKVRLGIQNGPNDAVVRIAALLPPELAASSTCTIESGRGGSQNTEVIAVGADGELFPGVRGASMGPGQRISFDCLLPLIENCGLMATISAEWIDLSDIRTTLNPLASPVVHSAEAATPVSPPCEVADPVEPVQVRIGIAAEASPRSVYRGDITTWNVTVTNYGGRVMDNAVITDVLHEALEPPRSLPEGASWDEATRTLRLAVPALAPGESTTISFPTQVRAWSQVPNTVSVRAGRHRATAIADVFGLVDYFS